MVETNGELLRRNRQAIKPAPEALPIAEEAKQTAVIPSAVSSSNTAGPVPSPAALRSSSRTVK